MTYFPGLTNSGINILTNSGINLINSGIDLYLKAYDSSINSSKWGQAEGKAALLFTDHADKLLIGTTNTAPVFFGVDGLELEKLSTSGIVFNESGSDIDFRIEADSNENGLYFDAGLFSQTGALGVGRAPSTKVDVQDNLAANPVSIRITNQSSSGFADFVAQTNTVTGPVLRAYGASAAGTIGGISVAGLTRLFADGTASAGLMLDVDDANTPIYFVTSGIERARFSSSITTFNETGIDTDFRIEGVGDAQLITSDANLARAGIGTPLNTHQAKLDITQSGVSTAIPVLHLSQADTDEPFIDFDGTSAANKTASVSSEPDGNTSGTAGANEVAAPHAADWTLKLMTRIEINGQDYWIPCYN